MSPRSSLRIENGRTNGISPYDVLVVCIRKFYKLWKIMKATEIVHRIDNLGRGVIPKEIRKTMRIREGDLLLTTLTPIDRFCIAIHSVVNRYKKTAE